MDSDVRYPSTTAAWPASQQVSAEWVTAGRHTEEQRQAILDAADRAQPDLEG